MPTLPTSQDNFTQLKLDFDSFVGGWSEDYYFASTVLFGSGNILPFISALISARAGCLAWDCAITNWHLSTRKARGDRYLILPYPDKDHHLLDAEADETEGYQNESGSSFLIDFNTAFGHVRSFHLRGCRDSWFNADLPTPADLLDNPTPVVAPAYVATPIADGTISADAIANFLCRVRDQTIMPIQVPGDPTKWYPIPFTSYRFNRVSSMPLGQRTNTGRGRQANFA